MSEPINPLEAGLPISADALNRLSAEVAARTVVRSTLVNVRQHSGGTLLSRKPRGLEPGPRRGGTVSSHPFKVIDASTVGPDAAKVRVTFGQVNSITPTIATVALDNATTPELTVVSGVVYLKINVDGSGLVTSVEVLNAASIPAETATEGYITIATVTVTSDAVTAINQSVTHSLGHQKCGTAVHNKWGV